MSHKRRKTDVAPNTSTNTHPDSVSRTTRSHTRREAADSVRVTSTPLAYDFWVAGILSSFLGPVCEEDHVVWNLLCDLYDSPWDKVHTAKPSQCQELSRNANPGALPHRAHWAWVEANLIPK
ncbi:uncharacterized protein PHACADRAFT_199896 [Phanerochaete carnosa HHB-10118-sp]|uniref:Uncharacterized protein n=1 Tax=Phanerochaete carnosa (strain HHB-10118-sp) TaxID=650164 RepID=K5VWT9_PHACS|nr:uncharacterized protein PHACADRAFT_199896 [Phanerochaete carnosa HHB-10118-sp]EKM51064.1 hypothetical protein PHACADRAFT_199896 [Phanerochaete carnosa HHB-10118-sp]